MSKCVHFENDFIFTLLHVIMKVFLITPNSRFLLNIHIVSSSKLQLESLSIIIPATTLSTEPLACDNKKYNIIGCQTQHVRS